LQKRHEKIRPIEGGNLGSLPRPFVSFWLACTKKLSLKIIAGRGPPKKDMLQTGAMMDTQNLILEKTHKWLEESIIALNLCPFAKAVHIKNQIRYTISRAENSETLLSELMEELKFLSTCDPAVVDTSLLIHPGVLNDFLDYNDFLEVADLALNELNLEEEIQIASFHPQYQFAGTSPDDVENYTNRSPYPMLHFLRVKSVSAAVDFHPDPESIPETNIKTLRNLSSERLKKLKELL
jgi:uncharacterized protein